MTSGPLAALILFSRGKPSCSAECGLDWSLKENQEKARAETARRFGKRVRLEFCDLDARDPCPPDLAERARSGQVQLPLLAIDGDPRITGYFDMRMLCDMIEAALEMGT